VNCGTDSSLNITGDITMSLWVNADVLSGWQKLLAKGDYRDDTYWIGLDGVNFNAEIGTTSWDTGFDLTVGVLTHLVITYNSTTNKIKAYKDGSYDGTGATAGADPASEAGRPLVIGYEAYPANYFNGLINEVSIFTSELSLAQVQELFNDGVAFDLDGSSLTGSPTLVSYYRNTGTGTWTDLEGSNHGTPTNATDTILLPEGTTSGKDILGFPLTHTNNGWLNLSIIPDRLGTDAAPLVIRDSSVFDIRTGSVTVEFWMKSTFTATHEIIEWQGGGAGLQFVANSVSNKVRWEIWQGGDITIDCTTSVNDNAWHHIVGVRNADTDIMQLWVDNTQEGGNVDSSSVGDVIITDNIWVGAGNSTTSWEGSIDEIRWYNRALSTAEITKNYKHGKGKHS